MIVAVLGTGIMGRPMAANMLASGLEVRVWNRTADKAAPLAEQGATLAPTPAEAARGADVVVTMLADGPAVRAVMTGQGGALTAMAADAVWAQMSTIGLLETQRCAAIAHDSGVAFADAPVLGTRRPAEQGALVVLAAGTAEALDLCAPVFDAVGSRTIRMGDPPAASKLKLVANNWVLAVTNATAECIALARYLQLDPELFLDAISGGALDLPYARIKGNAMINGDYSPSFPLRHALKDARLVLEAVSGLDLSGTRATLQHLQNAEAAGHGSRDMAAVYHGITDR